MVDAIRKMEERRKMYGESLNCFLSKLKDEPPIDRYIDEQIRQEEIRAKQIDLITKQIDKI